MNFNFLPKFQEGGAAPAPAPEGQDPMAVLLQGAQQAVESQDCNTAMQVCQMLLEMAGGAAGAEQGAPAEAAPAPAEGEPVMARRGGRLVLAKRISK